MKNENLYKTLCEINGAENVLRDEPMKKHTTFRIGGPARCFCLPQTAAQLAETVEACEEAGEPWYILGNGSNLLVGDKGYRGVIIQVYKNLNRIEITENRIKAQAGAMLSAVARKALEHSLTGFEFASGIPGTLGGAVVMNAGAYGGEMKDVIRQVRVLTPEGDFAQIPGHEMEFGYRTSAAAKRGYIVLEAELELSPGDADQIRGRMEELKEQRVSKQPLDLPSAGSTFKRPEGYFAGKLIMDAGLRGFCVGGARVSEKHCGFVVNTGGATAAQVRELMEEVSRRVKEQFGVQLEPEVKMLGEF